MRQENAVLPCILVTADADAGLIRQALSGAAYQRDPQAGEQERRTLHRGPGPGPGLRPADRPADEATNRLDVTSHQGEQPMKVVPLNDKIVVKRLEAEEKTAGGIVLPDTAKEKPKQGKVLSLGDGKLLDNGKRATFQVKEGDRVLFTSYAGNEVTVDGEEYLIMTEDDILAVVD